MSVKVAVLMDAGRVEKTVEGQSSVILSQVLDYHTDGPLTSDY